MKLPTTIQHRRVGNLKSTNQNGLRKKSPNHYGKTIMRSEKIPVALALKQRITDRDAQLTTSPHSR